MTTSSQLRFTKMHGLGNDFVMVNAIAQPLAFTPELIRYLANRHFGVGCDQVLVVERPSGAGIDFRYRIFNSDGGEVEQCGNGARCFVHFVRDEGLTDKTEIRVETTSGIITPRLQSDGEVTVDMGRPRFQPSEIPTLKSPLPLTFSLESPFGELQLSAVSMGNPHVVMQVPSVDSALVREVGLFLETHPLFPQRANVGFMELTSRTTMRLRVWERGAGETYACGTGACAAVVTAIRRGLSDRRVRVETRGGPMTIEWLGDDASVFATGGATRVFTGTVELPLREGA